MIDPRVIALAEIRRAELLEQAERHRLAQRAADTRRGKTLSRPALRDALAALSAHANAVRRRHPSQSSDLAAAAPESS
jgi:hypothetical protein